MGKGVFNLLWEKYSSWVISVESGKQSFLQIISENIPDR